MSVRPKPVGGVALRSVAGGVPGGLYGNCAGKLASLSETASEGGRTRAPRADSGGSGPCNGGAVTGGCTAGMCRGGRLPISGFLLLLLMLPKVALVSLSE